MALSEKNEMYAIYKCFNCGRETVAELPLPISDLGKCENCDAEDFHIIRFTIIKGGKHDSNDDSG
jgi:DNA-directed RNA polymerase subunit RPC12/RpoP